MLKGGSEISWGDSPHNTQTTPYITHIYFAKIFPPHRRLIMFCKRTRKNIHELNILNSMEKVVKVLIDYCIDHIDLQPSFTDLLCHFLCYFRIPHKLFIFFVCFSIFIVVYSKLNDFIALHIIIILLTTL